MYPGTIAAELRRRGHDVEAVTDRPDLRSLPDPDLFEAAQQERRAVVTENIADFSILADAADQANRPHYGLVLIDPAKHPRGERRTIGRLVGALDQMLNDHPEHAATSLRHWPPRSN